MLLFPLLLIPLAWGAPCPEGWDHFGENCYQYFLDVDNRVDYQQAQGNCISFGGKLAVVESPRERDFIQSISKLDGRYLFSDQPLVGGRKGPSGKWDNDEIWLDPWCPGGEKSARQTLCILLISDGSEVGPAPETACFYQTGCDGYNGTGYSRYICVQPAKPSPKSPFLGRQKNVFSQYRQY